MMFTASVFCLLVSLAGFLFYLLGTEHVLCLLGTGVFFTYVFACLHELGHILVCLFSKTKIAKASFLFWFIENGNVQTATRPLPFRVSFYSGNANKWIYLGGIVTSALLFILLLIAYLITTLVILLPICIAAALPVLGGLIGKQSDLMKILQISHRGE